MFGWTEAYVAVSPANDGAGSIPGQETCNEPDPSDKLAKGAVAPPDENATDPSARPG